MKTKITKKALSIFLTLLICISAFPLSMLTANATTYNISINNFTYPRPGAEPQGGFSYTSDLNMSLLGWIWKGSCGESALGPDSFKNFCSDLTNAGIDTNDDEFTTFVDTESYHLTVCYLLKNTQIPSGSKFNLTFYDTDGNSYNGYYSGRILVSNLISKLPEGFSLPDYISENDTILYWDSAKFTCSPTDHIHTTGGRDYNENGDWCICETCNKRMVGTESSHYFSNPRGAEKWTCVREATATQEGLYEMSCIYCKYAHDTVTVPKTGEQTVVTTYDQLRKALAKGGKQWIKIGSDIKQDDLISDNILCIDDPNADITIDFNKCKLDRTTMYDKYLFDIKRGSLRIWQRDGSNIGTDSCNISFCVTNSQDAAIFNVEEGGSLRLTNISVDANTTTEQCCFPCIRSKGNVQIDGGYYKVYDNETDNYYGAVNILGGNLTVNGGKFSANSIKNAAIVTTGEDEKTVTIDNGLFGNEIGTAVQFDKHTTATINGGLFDAEDADSMLYQDYGVYAQGGKLTINGGSFNGSKAAVSATDMQSLVIRDGHFWLYTQTPEEHIGTLVIYKNSTSSTYPIITGGTYNGGIGIAYGVSSDKTVNFSKIIPSVCKVTASWYILDTNITAHSIGTSNMSIKYPKPVITHQPKDTHCAIGETPAYIIEADNANEYIWHVIDENGKELSWSYLSDNGYATPGVRGNTFSLKNSSEWMDGKQVYCEVKGFGGTVISEVANVKIDKVIKTCNDLYFDDFDQIWNHKTIGDYKNVKTDSNAPYTIGEVSWQMFGKTFSDDSEIYCGDSFNLLIQILPKEGYELDLQGGKLNGIDDADYYHMSDGRQYLRFDISINAPDEYKTQNIELSVEPPVIGQTPATTAVCTAGYAVPGTPTWTPEDATFNSGTEYTVKIPVTAEYAWGDTSTVTAKVNGNDAEFVMEYKGSKFYSYYVVYNFGLPSETKPTTTTETEATTETKPSLIIGDVNGDGKVNVLDATLIQKQIVGLETFTTAQRSVADVNKNGKINILDATLIQKLAAGMISSF